MKHYWIARCGEYQRGHLFQWSFRIPNGTGHFTYQPDQSPLIAVEPDQVLRVTTDFVLSGITAHIELSDGKASLLAFAEECKGESVTACPASVRRKVVYGPVERGSSASPATYACAFVIERVEQEPPKSTYLVARSVDHRLQVLTWHVGADVVQFWAGSEEVVPVELVQAFMVLVADERAKSNNPRRDCRTCKRANQSRIAGGCVECLDGFASGKGFTYPLWEPVADRCDNLEPDTLDGGHYTCTEPRGHAGPHKGRNFVEGGTSQWPNAPSPNAGFTRDESRDVWVDGAVASAVWLPGWQHYVPYAQLEEALGKCSGCGGDNCSRMWSEQKKCCPDCKCKVTDSVLLDAILEASTVGVYSCDVRVAIKNAIAERAKR